MARIKYYNENSQSWEYADTKGGAVYTLPIATQNTLGGVKPVAKTEEMTQSVGVDANGGLWSVPSGGEGGSEWRLARTITVEQENITAIQITEDDNGNPLNCRELIIVWENPVASDTSDVFLNVFAEDGSKGGRLGRIGSTTYKINAMYCVRRLDENFIYFEGSVSEYGNSINNATDIKRTTGLFELGNITSVSVSTDGRKAIAVGAVLNLYVRE